MKHPVDSKCRICYKAGQHIKHIVAGCTIVEQYEDTNGHSKVVGFFEVSHPQCVDQLSNQKNILYTYTLWETVSFRMIRLMIINTD